MGTRGGSILGSGGPLLRQGGVGAPPQGGRKGQKGEGPTRGGQSQQSSSRGERKEGGPAPHRAARDVRPGQGQRPKAEDPEAQRAEKQEQGPQARGSGGTEPPGRARRQPERIGRARTRASSATAAVKSKVSADPYTTLPTL